MEKFAPLLAASRQELSSVDTKKVIQALLLLVVIFLLCTFTFVLFEIWNLNVWRHDSIPLLHSYWPKLVGEGRWINYLVFDLLKEINPNLAVFLDLFCLAVFSYYLARMLKVNSQALLVFIFLCLEVPSFYAIIGWPVTVLPTFVLLALAAFLSSCVPYKLFFILCGVLFHGTFNNIYNLTLLLVLVRLQPSKIKDFFCILLWWILGYFVGATVMLVVIKLITSNWGLQIEDWRRPNPLQSFSDIFTNLKTLLFSYKQTVDLLGGKIGEVLLLLTILGLLGISLKKRDFRLTYLVIGCVCVAASCFIQAFPLGLNVGIRTNFPFYFSIFLIIIVCIKTMPLWGIFLTFYVATKIFIVDVSSVHHYASLTNSWREEIQKVNIPPYAVNKVIICSSDEEVVRSEKRIEKSLELRNYLNEGFGVNWRQFSIFHSLGYRDFKLEKCPVDLKEEAQEGHLIAWLYRDRNLYIWY